MNKATNTSPTSFLAKKVAAALGSFCEIDESQMESKLLRKAHISLSQVKLKPRTLIHETTCNNQPTKNYRLELTGNINSVVFKWKWDMSGRKDKKLGQTGIIKKSSMTLKGVKIQLAFIPNDEQQDIIEDKCDQPSTILHSSSFYDLMDSHKSSSSNKNKNWTTKFARQLLNQTNFFIQDIQIIIRLPPKSHDFKDVTTLNKSKEQMHEKIIIEGGVIEVKSLGRINQPKKLLKNGLFRRKKKVKPVLLQQLNIGSISAYLVNTIMTRNSNIETNTYQILDPFRYSARIKQFHGDRFRSLSYGLDVVGDPLLPKGEQSINQNVKKTSFIISNEGVGCSEESHEQNDRDGNNECQVNAIDSSFDAVEIHAVDDEIETSLHNYQTLSSSASISHQHSSSFTPNVSQSESLQSADGDGFNEHDGLNTLDSGDVLNIHLGPEQTSAIFSLLSLLEYKTDNESLNAPPTNISQGRLPPKPQNPCKKSGKLHKESRAGISSKNSQDVNKSSIFELPFHAVSVELPNGNSLAFHNGRFHLKADSSLASFDGCGCILVNQIPALGQGCNWSLDLWRKEVVIDSKDNTSIHLSEQISTYQMMSKEEASLQLDLTSLRKVINGCREIRRSYKRACCVTTPSPNNASNETPIFNNSPSKWTIKFKVDGQLTI